MEGTLIADRYYVEQKLSNGNYGTVYLAKDHKGTHSQVALKWPVFEQEIVILSALSHPYIPTYIDSGRLDGDLFLVMERLEAVTLTSFFDQQGFLSFEKWSKMVIQFMEIFHYLQMCEKPIFYSDLHLANVLYSYKADHLYLVDFGHARPIAPSQRHDGQFCQKVLYWMRYDMLQFLDTQQRKGVEEWLRQQLHQQGQPSKQLRSIEALQQIWIVFDEQIRQSIPEGAVAIAKRPHF